MEQVYKLADRNVLKPEASFVEVERTKTGMVELCCPHCLVRGIFIPVSTSFQFNKETRFGDSRSSQTQSARVMRCPNSQCGALTFAVVALGGEVLKSYPPERLSFDASNIPPALVYTLVEAIDCHAAGAYRACAMMVRRLLEEICADAEVKGKDLHQRILGLRDKVVLPQALFDAMLELKAIGNDAAHIEARAYATIDKEEAELSVELALEILKARFQHEDLVARLRARRSTND